MESYGLERRGRKEAERWSSKRCIMKGIQSYISLAMNETQLSNVESPHTFGSEKMKVQLKTESQIQSIDST